MFRKVLIANGGEIALRAVRACREMGIQSVVAHSTRDRGSAAVRLADESVQIGPPQPRKSYLNAAAVIEAAVGAGVDAIHPGYGFLSEHPGFAEAFEAAGIASIAPPAAPMKRRGRGLYGRASLRRGGL